jgi:NADH-quinone oxidoreductase subunit N
MALPMPTLADLLPLRPEIFLCGAAFALLMIDLFLSEQRRGLTHFLALFILAAAAVLTARDMAMEPVYGFANMFVRDTVGDVLKLAIYAVAGLSFIYAKPYLQDRGLLKGEFYVLGLFSVLGMMLMVSAGSLLTLYLGLELLALSSYGLVGMDRDNPRAAEAAMKYFVLGSLASGILLYGMSMVYGATGSLMLGDIHSAAASTGDRTLLLFGVVFMLVGIAFKFGAAPFHMWLPDVYHGAPTAITLFIGAAPKLAAFGMAYRLLESGVGPLDAYWQDMVAWLAALSMVTGNLLALVQTNIKRMLAYSTISHVGFLFMGLAQGGPLGYGAAMFYAISYSIMAAAAFGAVILLSRKGFESEDISDFRGLWSRNPVQAVLILFVMASLAGVPPFLGFWAKLEVLRAVVDAGLLWLAVVGVLAAVVGAFYYLRVIKVMFFDEPEGEGPRVHADSHLRLVFAVNASALLFLGLYADWIMAWCRAAFPA